MTRGKSFRPRVVADLVEINNLQRYIVGRWRGATRVLDPGAMYHRTARPEELPENNLAELWELRRTMLRVAARAKEIEAMTAWRIAELEGRRR